jgi:hypothetical protein
VLQFKLLLVKEKLSFQLFCELKHALIFGDPLSCICTYKGPFHAWSTYHCSLIALAIGVKSILLFIQACFWFPFDSF